MRLKHNQDFSVFKFTFTLSVSISDSRQLLWQQLKPVSRRHAWLAIIMHILYSPCVSSPLLPAHPVLLTPLHSRDLHPLSSLSSSPPSRSWSYRSTGPTLHRLACDGTLQTCWPSSVIGTSYVPQHATWPSTCWTCSWTTTMWLLSSSTWSPCLACS